MSKELDLTIQLKNKNQCTECKSTRMVSRGILVINCINQDTSEWFCGFPCLLDFFGRIENGKISATTKLLEQFGYNLPVDSEE